VHNTDLLVPISPGTLRAVCAMSVHHFAFSNQLHQFWLGFWLGEQNAPNNEYTD
jgi:hypothetical protein